MKRTGATLIEIAIAAGVIGIMVLGFALFQTATVKANQRERDRAFAQQKCMQMMEELKAKVAGDANAALDDYGQADTTYSFVLTTDTTVTIPSSPLSDNVVEKAGYRFVRQVWVRPLPRDKGARQVTVRVFRSDGKSTPSVKAGSIPLASLANIFKSTPNIVVPTQQYDLYSIGCVENTLGKTDYCAYPWADAFEGYQNASISYLSTATSGLSMVIRPVRLTSYGRDTYYSPVQNDHDYWTHYYDHSKGALINLYSNTPLNGVYFRPGRTDWWNILAPGYAQSSYWYTPATPDGAEPVVPTRYTVKHGNTAPYLYENQPFYTYADQYNHAVRYYENIEKEYTRGGKTRDGTSVANPFLGSTDPLYRWASYRWYPDAYELTLRGLLDEMLEGKRKNAILVNNHGSLFPFIPMRNYSDAAKVPGHDADLTTLASQWGVTAASATDAKDGSHCRLVTHPRALEYDTGDVVEMRVFPHLADPSYIDSLYSGGGSEPPAAYRNGIIVLRGMRDYLADWNSSGGPENDIEVQACYGIHGKWPGGNAQQDYDFKLFNSDLKHPGDPADYISNWALYMDAYRWVRVWPANAGLVTIDTSLPVKGGKKGKAGKGVPIPYHTAAAGAYISSVTVQSGNNATLGLQDGDVIIKLKNIPYTPDQFDGADSGTWGKYGLAKDMTLFGMNYFPDPWLPDLTEGYANPDKQPRNSARFRILFKTKTAKAVEVITTIGDDPNLLHHQAPNRERTWSWVGTPAPETERYQLVGDPRHNPYADTRDSGLYNRYFGNLTTDAYIPLDESKFDPDWNRFDGTADGWGPNVGSKGRADCDVPRYFELWRKALLTANAMLANPTTDAFQIIALGGEYGNWSPPTSGGVSHSKTPMTGETNKGANYDEWLNPTLIGSKDKKWCIKPWLGEMYPDDQWSTWYTRGNLPSGDYLHYDYQNLDAFKNGFPGNVAFKRTKYLDHWGPMSFFNATTQFAYKSAAGTATIAGVKVPAPTDGRAVSADLKALLTETIHSYRSFSWNDGSVTPPDDWSGNEAKDLRTTLKSGLASSSNDAYYLAKDGQKAVAPFIMTRGKDSAYFMFFAPWNSWSGANDPYTAMRAFDACLLQGFLDMTAPNLTDQNARIRLLPRINVTKPEDDALVSGSSCAIEWTPDWNRWDGKPYSRQFSTYGTDGTQPTLSYIVKYSEDGKSWKYADGASASNQVGPYARYQPTKASTTPSLTLNTAGFKSKQYQVRVEAWRIDPGYESTHHSYAQFSINYTK